MKVIYEGIKRLIYKINMHAFFQRKIIALVRLDAIGDFILWMDAAKEFRKKYPNYRIVVVCRKVNVQIAEKIPYFDKVIAVDEKCLGKLTYCLLLGIRFLSLYGAMLYQCVYSKEAMMDTIVSMIPAYEKITIEPDETNYYEHEKERGNKIYDKIVTVEHNWKMELLRNAEFMRNVGFSEFKADLPWIPVLLDDFKIPDEEYYVIVLGTANYARAWDVNKYCEVARWIANHSNFKCYLLGTTADAELGEEFLREAKEIEVENLIGKTNLLEYIEYIRNAKFVLSGDTSAAHIATATKTKSISVVGGWHFERFLPYKTECESNKEYYPDICYHKMSCYYCNRKLVTEQCIVDEEKNGKWSCVLKVTSDDVINKVQKVLKEE